MTRGGITGALVAMLLFQGCTEAPCETRVGDLCPLVGTGELGFNRDGLAPEDTDLFLVSAARRGPDGRLYVMDFNNQRLRRIGNAGTIETVVGNGIHAIADVDAPLLATPLENPFDFGFLADGRVIFVSYHDPRVLTLGADGTLETIAGAGDGVVGVRGDEGDGGPATAALFMQLDGIAVAPDDTVYVSDSLANRVRRIAGGIITTVAGTGETGLHGDGGPATAATLHWPGALELDADGNLFIVDTFNHAIRRLAVDGTITTVVGIGTEGGSGDGGPATAAQLSQPFGLARAADGTLYIGDRGNFKIRRVGPDGVIDTIVGTGVEGATGDDGPALAATLGYTARLALDLDGDSEGLLIVDQSNSRVRRLTLR
jgi:sugar lactone lactonase YvrE